MLSVRQQPRFWGWRRGRELALRWELIHEVQVPKTEVPEWALRKLAAADPRLINETSNAISRQVRPPAIVTGAIATGRVLRRLLISVGQLSAVAPMGVLIDRKVDPADPALLDAALFGVGVVTKTADQAVVARLPEPVAPTPGPFPWWVSELAYRGLIETAGTTPTSR